MSLDCFFQEDIPEHLNFFLKAFFLKPPAGWVKTASLEKNLPWFMGVYGRYIYKVHGCSKSTYTWGGTTNIHQPYL